MFHRIHVEDWQNMLSSASLVIFFFVFAATALRVALMPRSKVKEMAAMPLNEDTEHRSS